MADHPHGVRCMDCHEVLADDEIFRRTLFLPGEFVEESVVELVCWVCFIAASTTNKGPK